MHLLQSNTTATQMARPRIPDPIMESFPQRRLILLAMIMANVATGTARRLGQTLSARALYQQHRSTHRRLDINSTQCLTDCSDNQSRSCSDDLGACYDHCNHTASAEVLDSCFSSCQYSYDVCTDAVPMSCIELCCPP